MSIRALNAHKPVNNKEKGRLVKRQRAGIWRMDVWPEFGEKCRYFVYLSNVLETNYCPAIKMSVSSFVSYLNVYKHVLRFKTFFSFFHYFLRDFFYARVASAGRNVAHFSQTNCNEGK